MTQELQQKKAARIAKGQSVTDAGSEVSTPTGFPQKEDDTQSLQSFASESFIMAVKDGDDRPRKSKAKLWEEIKISCMANPGVVVVNLTMELTSVGNNGAAALTRSLTLVYTLALLTILTRVQLNLLGRKKYLSSVASNAERDSEPTIHLEEEAADGYGTDTATNRQYLTFSWWLLHKGWRNIAERVDLAVKQVFGS